jgi:hypothetical protein
MRFLDKKQRFRLYHYWYSDASYGWFFIFERITK